MYSEKRADGIYVVDKEWGIDSKVSLTDEESARYTLIRSSMKRAYENRNSENMKAALNSARLILDQNGEINHNIATYLRHDGIQLTWKNLTTPVSIEHKMCLRMNDLLISLG